MSNLNNEYIVKLIGITINPLRMIIEYCIEGDLEQIIRNENEMDENWKDKERNEIIKIKWKMILDIAKGMNYLHNENNIAIAHRDLRSANILVLSLNEESKVCCKIGDFGLSLKVGEELKYGQGCWEWMVLYIIIYYL